MHNRIASIRSISVAAGVGGIGIGTRNIGIGSIDMIGPEIISITPEPNDAERVAIISALKSLQSELWPHSTAAVIPPPSPRWRYAGRPWQHRQTYGGWR